VEEPLEEFKRAGVTTLYVLPLYPQYSVTTTRSSHARIDLALKRLKWAPKRINAPESWFDEPHFVDAHADLILKTARTVPDLDPAKTVLLYSAHSLPLSTIEKKKDPYPKQIEATVEAINNRLGNRFPWRLAYQSKVGPMPWLGPSTSSVIKQLAADGAKQVIAIPVAFVSDHVETLYEIRMLFGDEARLLGITNYVAAEGLNDHPGFIRSLAAITRKSLGLPAVHQGGGQ
jgi:ferrochelatase